MALNNRTTRILVSVLAIPVIVALCLWGGFPFLLFTTFIGLTAFYEFADFNMNKENNVNIHLGLLSVFALILNKYFHFIPYEVLFILIVGLVSLTELFRNAGSAINNIGSTLLGILYIGLFSSTLIGLREGEVRIISYRSKEDILFSLFSYLSGYAIRQLIFSVQHLVNTSFSRE